MTTRPKKNIGEAWTESSDIIDSDHDVNDGGAGAAAATTTSTFYEQEEEAEEDGGGGQTDEDPLYTLFAEYCSFGAGHVRTGPPMMDSRTCQKLARDCRVLDGKRLTKVEVDLVFTKVRGRGTTRIDFAEFVEVTRQWAERKGMSHEELVDLLVASQGPTLNSVTLPDRELFHEGEPSFSGGSLSHDMSRLDLSSTSNNNNASFGTTREENEDSFLEKELVLHPDWYKVQNPNPQGPGEEVYYVNRFTNQVQWVFPARRLALTQGRVSNESSASVGLDTSGIAAPSRTSTGGQSRSSGSPHKSIFDKLTDHSLYTGTHKHRFDPSTGRGLGKFGRDTPAKASSLGYSGLAPKGNFHGSTNTRTDVQINDLSEILTRR